MTKYLITIDYDESIEASSEEEAKEMAVNICRKGFYITADCIDVEEAD